MQPTTPQHFARIYSQVAFSLKGGVRTDGLTPKFWPEVEWLHAQVTAGQPVPSEVRAAIEGWVQSMERRGEASETSAPAMKPSPDSTQKWEEALGDHYAFSLKFEFFLKRAAGRPVKPMKLHAEGRKLLQELDLLYRRRRIIPYDRRASFITTTQWQRWRIQQTLENLQGFSSGAPEAKPSAFRTPIPDGDLDEFAHRKPTKREAELARLDARISRYSGALAKLQRGYKNYDRTQREHYRRIQDGALRGLESLLKHDGKLLSKEQKITAMRVHDELKKIRPPAAKQFDWVQLVPGGIPTLGRGHK